MQTNGVDKYIPRPAYLERVNPACLYGPGGEYVEHWPEREPEVTAPRTLDHLREIHRWDAKDWVVVALMYGAIAGWLLGFAWLLGQLDVMRIVRFILSQG